MCRWCGWWWLVVVLVVAAVLGVAARSRRGREVRGGRPSRAVCRQVEESVEWSLWS